MGGNFEFLTINQCHVLILATLWYSCPDIDLSSLYSKNLYVKKKTITQITIPLIVFAALTVAGLPSLATLAVTAARLDFDPMQLEHCTSMLWGISKCFISWR